MQYARRSKVDNSDLLLQLLKESGVPWCFIFLDTDIRDNKPFVCSQKFQDILIDTEFSPSEFTLSWQKFVQIFGPSPDSPFQQGIRHIMRFGGEFSCQVMIGSKMFTIEGKMASGTHMDFVTVENAAAPPILRQPKNKMMSSKQHGIFLTLIDQTVYSQLSEDLERVKSQYQKLQYSVNAVPFPIWIRNSDEKLDFCNKAYAKLLETQPQQAISSQWEIVDTSQVRRLKDLHKLALKTGKAQTAEIVPIRPRYKAHVLQITETPVMCGNSYLKESSIAQEGVRKYTVGCAIDISKEKNIELDYQHMADVYRTTLLQMPLPFLILYTDGRIALASTRFIELFEIDVNWLEQHPFKDDLLEWLRDHRKLPEYISVQSIKERQQQWCRGEEIDQSDLWHLPNGLVLNLSAVPYPEGGIVLIVQDITQSLLMEGNYKSLQGVYQAIIEQSHDALFIIGTDHRVKMCSRSAEAILNVATDQLIGRHIKVFIEAFAKQHHLTQWQETVLLALELRNNKTQYTTLLDQTVIQWDYVPLPDGGHLLRFVAPTLAQNQEEDPDLLPSAAAS